MRTTLVAFVLLSTQVVFGQDTLRGVIPPTLSKPLPNCLFDSSGWGCRDTFGYTLLPSLPYRPHSYSFSSLTAGVGSAPAVWFGMYFGHLDSLLTGWHFGFQLGFGPFGEPENGLYEYAPPRPEEWREVRHIRTRSINLEIPVLYEYTKFLVGAIAGWETHENKTAWMNPQTRMWMSNVKDDMESIHSLTYGAKAGYRIGSWGLLLEWHNLRKVGLEIMLSSM